jgi:hypothetical protein
MKVLSNCTVTKLREYSQSFIREYEKEICLVNDYGHVIRTMKKGTKVLIHFAGEEITERQFNTRVNKANRLKDIERNKENESLAERNRIADRQLALWVSFIDSNPDKKERYLAKCNTMPSSKWRNYLRMKAARHINNESFAGLEVSAPDLKSALSK